MTFFFQDKALRRISELREHCQLEQSAKRHLEEELRSDMEEKEHIIKALQVKSPFIFRNSKFVKHLYFFTVLKVNTFMHIILVLTLK